MSTTDNNTSYTVITGTSYKDSIKNSGSNVKINAGAGDDYISNYKRWRLTDNYYYEYEYISGDNVSIDAGAGNDSIDNESGINATLLGGKGNDSINNDGAGMVYVYRAGDGKDVISGFNEDDTILIPDATWSTAISGSDVIVTIGEGAISLRGATSLNAVNIVSTAADVHPINIISNSKNNTLLTGTSYKDSVYNRGQYVMIETGAGDDDISNYTTQRQKGYSYHEYINSDNVSIDSGDGNDQIRNDGAKVTIAGGEGNDSITNYDGNYWSIKGGDSVSINGGEGDDSIINSAYPMNKMMPTGCFFRAGDDVTIEGGKGNDYIDNGSGFYALIDGGAGSDTIDNYGGTRATISGGDGNDSISNQAAWHQTGYSYYNYVGGNFVSIDGGAGNDSIANDDSRVTISGGTGDDLISLGSFAKGNKIFYSAGDGNDTVYGFRADSTLRIGNGTGTYSTIASGNDIIVSVGNGKITLVGAASLSKVNIDGKNPLLITGTRGADSLTNAKASISIDGGSGNDIIRNYVNGKYVLISGGAGNDKIYNTGSNVTINGGTGNDLISLGSAVSNNLIEYNKDDGNDTIYGFGSDDTLSIGAAIKSASVSGSDVMFTVGSNTLTIKNAKDKTLALIDSTGKSISTIISGAGATQNLNASNTKANMTFAGSNGGDTLTNWSGGKDSTILGNAGNDSIKNTAANVSINGGDGNDKITNSGANVTITGGAGNDSLWGGNGAETFIYNNGDGKDIIYGFGDTDMLEISGDWVASYYSSSGRIGFKVGNTYSAIILENSTATTFNINGTAYQISGNTLAKK